MVDKNDVNNFGSSAVIGGMVGLGVATVTGDTIVPNYPNSINEVAITKTVDEALSTRPDATKMSPSDFAEADKKWVESIARKALKNKDEIQQELDAPQKKSEDRKTNYTVAGAGVGGGASLLMSGVAGWKRREEKKKQAAANDSNNDKSV